MNTQKPVRLRFAPSPTGHLHIGGLRTIIFNWLYARHHQGSFLIRIEDTDLERSKAEYTESILHTLQWMGVESDEQVVIQSERVPEHRRIAHMLVEQGKAYYCSCSQEEVIERHKQKYGADDMFIKYDGACRGTVVAHPTKKSVIRFALPQDIVQVSWNDLVRGHISTQVDQLDDFIIVRSDGMSMYNFAVVIDDAYMRISHVIRGEEHVSNTPKQILLYQALGYLLPEFAHVSMILGPSGEKLSKRDGATSVLEYKAMGYLPDALFNYLVRLGWAHGDQELFTRQELITLFTIEGVHKKPAIFDVVKLEWFNGMYIRQTSDQILWKYLVDDVRHPLFKELAWTDVQINTAIGLYKERVKTLGELAQELLVLHGPAISYNKEDSVQHITPETANHLRELVKILAPMDSFTVDLIAEQMKALAKTLGVKLVQLAQPTRIALVGKSSSPAIFDLLAFLGKQESIRRITALIDHIS
jgi:glutamyl-tRNA synthetase